MEDFSKRNTGKKNFEENMFLDKKIQNSKSNYLVQEMEKDFERILSYKKLISHKSSLYFESPSPSKSKTGLNFFSSKKSSNAAFLPKLSKCNTIDPKIKTTSTNFFKNKKTVELDNKNKMQLSSRNLNSIEKWKKSSMNNNNTNNDYNSTANNPIENEINNLKIVSGKLTRKESEKDANKYNLQSQSSNNFKNFNEEILEEINKMNVNNNPDYNANAGNSNFNKILVQNNDSEQMAKHSKVDLEVRLPLESKESIKNDLKLTEDKDKINSKIADIIHIQTENKTLENKNSKENLVPEKELNNGENTAEVEIKNLDENLKIAENEIKNEEALKTEIKNNENENGERLVIKKPISYAKTLINLNIAAKENSFYELKESPKKNGNRTYLISAKNRFVIDSNKTINEQINNQTARQLSEEQIVEKAKICTKKEEQEALEKMRKLEEMELNDDLSCSEKKSINNYENFEIKNEIENNNNEKIITATKSLIENKTKESKIKSNENSQILKSLNEKDNEIQNKNKKKSEEAVDKKQEAEFRNNSKENISNYFAATNQNFYSSAVNFNNNNNNINGNFYSSKNNILCFDKTVSSNNIFSLTTVNNFNQNNVLNNNNNINNYDNNNNNFGKNQKQTNHPSPQSIIPIGDENISQIRKNNIKSVSKGKNTNPSFKNKAANFNKSKQTFSIKKSQKKSISPKKVKNGEKEEKEIFSDLDEEENLKSKKKFYNIFSLN